MLRPTIAVTMGDPAGVGPEIILKFIDDYGKQRDYNLEVIGDFQVLKKVSGLVDSEVEFYSEGNQPLIRCRGGDIKVHDLKNVDVESLVMGETNKELGKASFEYLDKAINLSLSNEIDGIATAPISKTSLNEAGIRYPGQTEILAERTNVEDYALMLYSEKLKVVHVTTHIGIKEVPELIKKKRVFETIRMADSAMRDFGIVRPRIGVAALNPHAGECGAFGSEEKEEIVPALALALEHGLKVDGPISPDVVFARALEGEYDVVVAMYHDQGHIALKLSGFDDGVNVTLGIPIIRTSVCHGTAFDIAGKGIASEGSLKSAVMLAARMAGKKGKR